MESKRLYLLIAFVAIFLSHGTYLVWQGIRVSSQWAQTSGNTSIISAIGRYFQNQDFLMGISYGLSMAFMVYAFLRLREGQAKGVAGILGGATLTGLLYFGGCFLTGCCGSPMLDVYLNLFGASFLGFQRCLF